MRKALALLPLAALVAGCGAAQSTPRVYTSPAAPHVVLPKGQHYQGRNSKVIGTVVVTKGSTLHWASDGPVFQLWDKGQKIRVRTQEHAGAVQLAPGTYTKLRVIAFGNWVITVSPR